MMNYSTQLLIVSVILIGISVFNVVLVIGRIRRFLRSRREKK